MTSLAIIIPAWNEADYLPRTLSHVYEAKAALPEDVQARVIVVDNNSSDATAEVARENGAEVVFEPENQIARARNRGAEEVASCDFLFFVDADTLLSGEVLREAYEQLATGQVTGGGARIQFDAPLPFYATVLQWLWNHFAHWFSLSAGAFIFARQDDFAAVGGFDETVYAAEDVILSRGLKRHARQSRSKRRFVVTEGYVETSARKFQWHGPFSMLWMLIRLALMPWSLRKREKLGFWYERGN